MPTVVTKTIGPTGRDYATFTAAEADVENIATAEFGSTDLVANDGAIVFEADAATYSGQFTLESSLVCDATRNVTYKPASGSEHGGDKNSGVILTGTGLSLYLRDDFVLIEGLVFKSTTTNTTFTSIEKTGWVVDACIFVDDSATGQSSVVGLRPSPDASNPIVFQNCLVIATGSRGLAMFGTGGYARWSNNTVLHTGYEQTYRSHNPTLTLEAYNNIGFGGNGVNMSTATVTGAGNVSGNGGQWATSISAGNQTWAASTAYDPGAGDFALYVGKNGALLDSPHNDVINGGVGPASNSDVPTTDILGDTRSGTTTNPGAFALAQATAVLTRTIGPVGRDYATFTAAEADVENIGGSADLVFENERIEFLADAGTYSESGANVSFTSSLVSDATRNVTWTYAAGSNHGGDPASGVRCTWLAPIINDSFVTFDGLVFAVTDSNGVQPRGDEGIVLRNLIVDQSAGSIGIYATGNGGSPSAPMVIENCRVLAQGGAILARRTSAVTADGSVRIVNNTVSTTGSSTAGIHPFNTSTGTLAAEVVNNLVLDADYDFVSSGTVALSGSNNFGPRVNASFAFPAAIQGSPYPITPTTNTTPGFGDYAIYEAATGALIVVDDNAALGGGVGPAANADVPVFDIRGVKRIGGGCDLGAFEGVRSRSTDVWDVVTATHTTPGTFGELLHQVYLLTRTAAGGRIV